MIRRRTALATLGGFGAALIAPPAGAARIGKAPRLRPGDTVGVIAPASAGSSEDSSARAEWWLKGMGLVPKLASGVDGRFGYLAGTDADRAADLNAMYADPEVRAVFALRGGWGSARILPLLDWAMIRRNPKLLIGFSDITALHLAFSARAGYPTIHGGNAGSSWQPAAWESLWRLAFAADRPVLGGPDVETATGRSGRTIRGGVARGRLLGGNLTIVSTLMGTGWLPSFKGAILFVEDVNEVEYRVDRMFQQLRLAGVLDGLAGIVFGQCTKCQTTEPDYRGFTLDEVIDQYLAPLGIPAFTGGNFGHVANQLSLPSGAMVELDAGARTIRLLEAVVA